MTRNSWPHGKSGRGIRPLAPMLLLLLASTLLGCKTKPDPSQHIDRLREIAGELKDAYQTSTRVNRETYLRLLTAQGRARLDSEHAECAMRLLGIANERLRSCEASTLKKHVEDSSCVRRKFRAKIAAHDARQHIGEGDVYAQSLVAAQFLADVEESALELSTAMQAGSNCIRRKVAASLGEWGKTRLKRRAAYERRVRGLMSEFKKCEGKVRRTLLVKHHGFLVQVGRVQELLDPPKAEKVPSTTRSLHIRSASAVEGELRHYLEKRNGEVLEFELLALAKRCRGEEESLRSMTCQCEQQSSPDGPHDRGGASACESGR